MVAEGTENSNMTELLLLLLLLLEVVHSVSD